MRKTVTQCDRCGRTFEEDSKWAPISYLIGRHVSAAGDMENEYDNLDLCTNCLKVVTQHLLKFIAKDIWLITKNDIVKKK
jgi:hypothetical protein